MGKRQRMRVTKGRIDTKTLDGQQYPMPLSVCGDKMVREAATSKGPMTYALSYLESCGLRIFWL